MTTREPFSATLLKVAGESPSALQMAAVSALQTWALLTAARHEAEQRRDAELATRLMVLESVLTDRDD